jgi:hypothetical protein
MHLIQLLDGGIDPMWTAPTEPLRRSVRMLGPDIFASALPDMSLKSRSLYPVAESSR